MRRSYKFATLVAFVLSLANVGQLEAQYSGPVAIKQHTESAAAEPPPAQNQTVFNITGGAALNTGNTRAYTVTLGGHLGVIQGKNLLSLDALGLINASKAALGGGQFADHYVKTAANVVGRARYDRFLSHNDALFLALVPRRDVLAGLDLRLQMQGGYSRNLYAPSALHRFWAEAGYDLTYDNFAPITTNKEQTFAGPGSYTDADGVVTQVNKGTSVILRTPTTSTPDSEYVHSARVFLGYSNSLNAIAQINLGAETLFDVTYGKNVRVNTLADITTSVSSHFKMGFVSRMFFDNVPVDKTYKKADFVSTLNVIYTYDSLANAKKADACAADIKKATEAAHSECATQKALPAVPQPQPQPQAQPEPAAGAATDGAAPVQTPVTTSPAPAAPAAPTTPPAATAPVTPPVQAPSAPPAQ
ncbi:MAG: DUF481 domain-containing protein [Myxococcales bacterium]